MPFEPFEDEATAQGYRFIVGCDEAGRGPLAGPVVGAACYIPKHVRIHGIADSKQLTPEKRASVYKRLRAHKDVAVGVSVVSVAEIDEINILQASLKAMWNAVCEIGTQVDLALIDGNKSFRCSIATKTVVGGDDRVRSIAAASIIAKVTRDEIMVKMAKHYPGYGFEKHKGYATPEHLEALKRLGPTDQHRKSFAPVKEYLLEPLKGIVMKWN